MNNWWQYINVANIFIPLYQKIICGKILMLQILLFCCTKKILLHIKTMEWYCVFRKEKTGNKNFGIKRTKYNRLMFV